jgi:uncharacterized membrane protein YtjA (UPF0391 family)
MLKWALLLTLALAVGAFGFGAIEGSADLARVLLFLFFCMLIVFVLLGAVKADAPA